METNKASEHFEEEDIHFRDQWQFELKSDFLPHPSLKESTHTQEFFLFVPDSLQINPETYPKDFFYQDQTNLIRFKTPVFTLKNLIDPEEEKSPIFRIHHLQRSKISEANRETLENELKLLGNIVRSALRLNVQMILKATEYSSLVQKLCEDIKNFKKVYRSLSLSFHQNWMDPAIDSHFSYVEEFINKSIHYYLISLKKNLPEDIPILDEVILQEIEESEKLDLEPLMGAGEALHNEYILYRRGLLNKFVVDVLLLTCNRYSFLKTYQNIIGAIAAAIAMLFFFILYVWQSQIVVINSTAFVVITVILYVLKDRIKDGIKEISYKMAFGLFPDYTTQILSPNKKITLGKLKESFSFASEESLPQEIILARNREFHFVLESFKRPEQVLYHKKTVTITQNPEFERGRRHGLNIIFRFHIQRFLAKASDPNYSYTTLDKTTKELVEMELSKVYHLNIILRNTYISDDLSQKVELKKYRIVVDKNGIKRIEFVDGSQLANNKSNLTIT